MAATPFSASPQLIEITDGPLWASCTAVVIASRKPAVVFGAKYTTIFAPGATAPTTSMSSITSPSAPCGPSGTFPAPSTETDETSGCREMPSWSK